ncbi:MAG TPA: c-type cytochrome [Terriglobales bacterium]|nr:c-type cytochrome [Terriglobales bacterium]
MRTASILLLLTIGALAAGCGKDPEKMSDAELGLNAQQARGRRVYNIYCLSCHPAYSTHGNKGPGLKGLYRKPYLPSGLTPTDEHVIQSIVQGRRMMPRFGDSLSQNDLKDMIAYMHTL